MSRGAEVSSYHALDILDLQSDLLVYIRIRFILDPIKGYSTLNILNWGMVWIYFDALIFILASMWVIIDGTELVFKMWRSTAAANKLEQAGFQNIAGELASSMSLLILGFVDFIFKLLVFFEIWVKLLSSKLFNNRFCVFLSRDDEDDSVAKMKAAEEALEAKQKVTNSLSATCSFFFLSCFIILWQIVLGTLFMQNYPMILLYLYCMAAPCIS